MPPSVIAPPKSTTLLPDNRHSTTGWYRRPASVMIRQKQIRPSAAGDTKTAAHKSGNCQADTESVPDALGHCNLDDSDRVAKVPGKLPEIARWPRRLHRPLVDGADLWRSSIDSIGLSADDITGECPWQRLVVGELQLLMDGSPSQDENSAIPTFSTVLCINKG